MGGHLKVVTPRCLQHPASWLNVLEYVVQGQFTSQFIAKFWSMVQRSDAKSCWLWSGKPSRTNGYGRIRCLYKTYRAHRVAYQLTYGEIPQTMWVLHRCDVPMCCNPSHLFLGTNADNSADRTLKGRSARGDRHGAATHPETRARGQRHGLSLHPERCARGERAGSAKLTGDMVRAILLLRRSGIGPVAIARQYGVHRKTISRICLRQMWKHIAVPE